MPNAIGRQLAQRLLVKTRVRSGLASPYRWHVEPLAHRRLHPKIGFVLGYV